MAAVATMTCQIEAKVSHKDFGGQGYFEVDVSRITPIAVAIDSDDAELVRPIVVEGRPVD